MNSASDLSQSADGDLMRGVCSFDVRLPLAFCLWSASSAALAAPCTDPVSAASVDALVAKVDVAFVGSDTDAIPAMATELRDSLPCVTEALDGRQVGGIHRVLALDAFIARDRDRVRQSLAAVRSADPNYTLPEFLPPAHPMRADFEAIALVDAPTSPLPAPENGRLWVNGKVAERRPDGFPAVVQWEKGRGKIGMTALLLPGDPAPAYPVAKAVAVGDGGEKPNGGRGHKEPKEPKDPKDPKGEHEGPRWVLVGAGGGAVVVSGVLGLVASGADQRWGDCAGEAGSEGVTACVDLNADAAKAAWTGEPGWDDLNDWQRRAETIRYGMGDASADGKVAGAAALGALAVGAGLITVGFVW